MTQRDNYRRYVHFDPGAHCPNIEPGPLPATWERWKSEGLSPQLDPCRYDEWCDAFGLDRYPLRLRVQPVRLPLYEEKLIEQTDTTVTLRLSDGSIIKDNKGPLKTIPHEVRPAVTNRAEWDRLREWLNVDAPLPDESRPEVAAVLRQAREATGPVHLHAGSLVGQVRNWLGFERFAVMAYDDPGWLEEIIETCCRDAERQVRFFGARRVPLEGIHFWEDICYKNGPILGPAHFRRLVTPRYRRVAELAAQFGYDRISVDSDGNLSALIDAWLEGGVNVLLPLEVQAGMDVNDLQRRYDRRVVLWGGIHKSRLAGGEKEIVAELERVRPAVRRGGYIPGCDHNLPPEISFDNYRLYLRLRRELLGLESRPPREAPARD